MTQRWQLGTWLGKRFHTEEHIVARRKDGLEIRSRAVKVMLEERRWRFGRDQGALHGTFCCFERCTA